MQKNAEDVKINAITLFNFTLKAKLDTHLKRNSTELLQKTTIKALKRLENLGQRTYRIAIYFTDWDRVTWKWFKNAAPCLADDLALGLSAAGIPPDLWHKFADTQKLGTISISRCIAPTQEIPACKGFIGLECDKDTVDFSVSHVYSDLARRFKTK